MSCLMAWLLALALCTLCDGKPRELFEIGPDDQETGLEPFYDGNMAAWLTKTADLEQCSTSTTFNSTACIKLREFDWDIAAA